MTIAGTATRLGAERPGLEIGHLQGMFLFTRNPKMLLELTQFHGQWVPEALSPRLKRPRRESDNKSPSSAEIE
jgi:hypothetical protein